jgi:hypothetical protein
VDRLADAERLLDGNPVTEAQDLPAVWLSLLCGPLGLAVTAAWAASLIVLLVRLLA